MIDNIGRKIIISTAQKKFLIARLNIDRRYFPRESDCVQPSRETLIKYVHTKGLFFFFSVPIRALIPEIIYRDYRKNEVQIGRYLGLNVVKPLHAVGT